MTTLDPAVSGESDVPALKNSTPRSFRNRRQQLALWLMLGCGASGILDSDAALADGLQWTNGLQLTEPGSRVHSSSSIKASNTDHRIQNTQVQWNRPQTPADDRSNQSAKTPSIRPTGKVNSVLGIRVGSASDGAPVTGTSIQLLAPKAPSLAPKPSTTSASAENAQPENAARSTSTPKLVTRDNATIRSYRETWQPSVPSFNPHQGEIVLLGRVRNTTPNEAESNIASLGTPDPDGTQANKLRPEGSVAIPSDPTETDGIMVGNRQYYPSFIRPKDTEAQSGVADQIDPRRAPLSDELMLEQPSTNRIIGSGLPKTAVEAEPETNLAPVTDMPVFDKRMPAFESTSAQANSSKSNVANSYEPAAKVSNKIPTQEMSSEQEAGAENLELLPPPQNSKASDNQVTSQDSSATVMDHDGSNEGEGEASEDAGDVVLSKDLTMELLLEEAGDLEPFPNQDASADSMTEVEKDSPALSSMRIKPLNPPPPKEVLEIISPQLESVETDVNLRDIHNDVASLKKTAPISQLDATGRVKQHSGLGAFEQLSPAAIRLKSPILQTLRMFHARTERADSRSNWGMMHQIMVYGADTRIIARNRNYSAIAWVAGNNVCRGSRLMTSSRGKIQVREGTGLQGHQAQFLAIMSLVGVPSDYPLYVGNQRFKMKDLVEVEAAACKEGQELTFTLIGLSHYLDTETTWTGIGGETWDFERLIAAELSQPIVGAACGGTHRLMSFAHALRKRRLEGQPIDGQWKRAEDFLDEFVQYTYSLQNRDGSMSTDWFESREDNGDMKRKVQTTGHMVEFLLTYLPDEDLADERITRSITFLNNAMRRIQIDDAAVGYRGHALRSLAMYYRRMYGEAADYPAPSVTKHRRVQRRR